MAQLLAGITYRSVTATGQPNAFGKVYTYAAGTLTNQAVYTTAAGNVPQTNPVILDAAGTAQVWLDPALTYRIREFTALDVLVRDVDNIGGDNIAGILASTASGKGASLIGYDPAASGAAGLGAFLNYTFGRTTAEIAAGVTPTNYAYFPGDPRRYGAVGDDSTDNAAAFLKWTSVGGRMHLPAGNWRTTGNDGAALRFYTGGIHLTADPLAILKPIGWIDGVNVGDADYPAVLTQLYKVTIEGLTIDGTLQLAGTDDTYGNGINVTSVDLVSIRHNKLIGIKNQVIVSTYYNIDTDQKYIDVSHNFIDGVRLNQIGIGLEGQAESATVIGNRILDCNGDGVQASYNNGGGVRGTIVINDNNITGPTGGTGRGIYVGDNIFNVVIDGNLIEGLDISIRCTSLLTSTFDYLITSNKCYEWTSGGIFIFPLFGTDNSEALINGNHIKSSVADASSSGIYAGKNATVTANKVRSGSVGILTDGSGHFIANNDVDGPTVSIDVSSGSASVVSNNRISTVPGLASDTRYSPPLGYGGSVASAASLTLPVMGDVFTITGTTSITSIMATGCVGRTVRLIFAGALTVTDGSNLVLAGSFVTTTDDSITLTCTGSNWYEVCRSVN